MKTSAITESKRISRLRGFFDGVAMVALRIEIGSGLGFNRMIPISDLVLINMINMNIIMIMIVVVNLSY